LCDIAASPRPRAFCLVLEETASCTSLRKTSLRSAIVSSDYQTTSHDTAYFPTYSAVRLASFVTLNSTHYVTLCVYVMLCGSEAPTFINDPGNEISVPLPFSSSPPPVPSHSPFSLPLRPPLSSFPPLCPLPLLFFGPFNSFPPVIPAPLSCPFRDPLGLNIAKRSGRAL